MPVNVPVSFPIIPVVKLAKILILLEKFSHSLRKSVFSIGILCNYAVDSVVYLGWS